MIEPGVYYDLSHSQYHALEGYVSNSYLSRLNICPAAARIPQEETDAMRIGTAFHSFILDGPVAFARDCAVLPEINRRTNAGKDEYAAFCESNKGKAIITADDLKAIMEMDKSVKAHPLARNMIGEGTNEVSVFWTDPFSGLPCKARPDKVPNNNTLIDLKKTRSADPVEFGRSIIKYGYARQAAFYLDGMRKATGEDFDLFAFIAVEDKEPYRVEVYTLSQMFIEYGRNDYQFLINIENRCRVANSWPNYTNETATELELPKWLSHAA